MGHMMEIFKKLQGTKTKKITKCYSLTLTVENLNEIFRQQL